MQHRIIAERKEQFAKNPSLNFVVVLNAILLGLAFSLVFFFGFILVPFSEHTLVSISITTLILILLAYSFVVLLKKKPFAFRFLMLFNIPLSLFVGASLLIFSFYAGFIFLILTIIGTITFIFYNNYLLFSSNVQELSGMTVGRMLIFLIGNIVLGLSIFCYLFYSLNTLG